MTYEEEGGLDSDFSKIFNVEVEQKIGYVNYHKHSGSSAIKQPDSFVSMKDYIKRVKELGHTTVSVVEHGSAGDFMKVWKQTKEAGLKFLFGMEIYFKFDINNGKGNHLILLARNMAGIKTINKVQSLVIKNRNGFWGLGDLLKLNKENVYITTACLASPLREDTGEETFKVLYEHFQDSLYLEVQPHINEEQRKWNKRMIEYSQKFGLKLVAGIDSHYLYPEQKILREIVLKTKGISYGDEDKLLLDYPTREEIVRRFKEQNALTDYQIHEALNNTFDFEETVGIHYDEEIKMPTVYKNENNMKSDFLQLCNTEFVKLVKNKDVETINKYREEVQREIKVFSEGKMISYPLLCHHIVKLAEGNPVKIEDKVYNLDCEPSLATRTGRGSAGSPLLHNLLGLTTLDRLDSEVPLLFERFISLDRLKAKTMPDLDINVASQFAFERASKILLGEENAYWMFKEDTLQIKASIKIVTKYYDYSVEFADELIEDYIKFEEKQDKIEKVKVLELVSQGWIEEEAKKEAKKLRVKIWEGLEDETIIKIYKYSEGLIGAIVGISRHPCGLCIYDGNIEETFGLIRMKDGSICASCSGETLDTFKFLKLDILKVDTWDLIFDAYKDAGVEIPSVKELSNLFYSTELYNNCLMIMENGLTTTLCQFNTENGKQKIMQYIAKTIGEISDLSAVMRPACASIIDIFLNRESFQYGIPALDSYLSKTTGCKLPLMIYQEAIMGVLQLTGDIDLSEAYIVIKAISKKKEKVILSYKERFLKGFSKYLLSVDDNLDEYSAENTSHKVWEIIEASAEYAFNSAHSLAYAYDFVYGCVAKASFNHPDKKMRKLCLSYFRKALEVNFDDKDVTNDLLEELPYFNIKLENPSFLSCANKYTIDYDRYTIYRSLSSVSGIGDKTAQDFIQFINNNQFDSFIDFLIKLKNDKNISFGKANLKILVLIDFFRNFGGIQYLLNLLKAFFDDTSTKYESTSKFEDKKLEKLAEREGILRELQGNMQNEDIPLLHKLKYQLEYLGVSYITLPEFKGKYIITDVFGDYNQTVIVYNIGTGKSESFKYQKNMAKSRPLKKLDFIAPKMIEKKPKAIIVGYREDGSIIWGASKTVTYTWLLKFDRVRL